jgi:hypothetical protein
VREMSGTAGEERLAKLGLGVPRYGRLSQPPSNDP